MFKTKQNTGLSSLIQLHTKFNCSNDITVGCVISNLFSLDAKACLNERYRIIPFFFYYDRNNP